MLRTQQEECPGQTQCHLRDYPERDNRNADTRRKEQGIQMGCPQMFHYGSTIGVPRGRTLNVRLGYLIFLQFSTDNWKIRVRNHSCPPDQKTLQGLATLWPTAGKMEAAQERSTAVR